LRLKSAKQLRCKSLSIDRFCLHAECEQIAHIMSVENELATRIPGLRTTMRKEPRQARARATIEFILDGATRILGERGWAGFTTNAVADAAGISIGSLYQYFPNKFALIEAVRRRHFDEILAVFRMATDERTSRVHRISAFVDGMIAVHNLSPAAHRVLLEEVPSSGAADSSHLRFDAEYRKGCEAFFAANARMVRSSAQQMAAQVLAAAVVGVVHEAAHQRLLSSPALRGELIALVDAYLSSRGGSRREL
jgi:AcrR family transcriptional regulator